MMMKRLALIGFALVIALSLTARNAVADKIILKDGTVLEGVIEEEQDTFIWFIVKVGSVEQRQLVAKSQIDHIERDAPGPDVKASRTLSHDRIVEKPKAIPDGATKVAFVSLRDEVGLYLNAYSLKEAVKKLEDDDPDVLVLVINSGGGAAMEVTKLSDLIDKELKKSYRVVAWVENAFSAACMTTWNCEEIYMNKGAALGANVAFSQDENGKTTAAKGDELEFFLRIGRKLSKRGKHDPLVMRAMQTFMALSCDIDEHGNVTWYKGDKGEYLVSPSDRILTLNSVNAVKYKIARGTADTKEELMRAMGIPEWVEVGQDAEKSMVEFRKNVKKLSARGNELLTKYGMALQMAQSGDEDLRNSGIGRARSVLRQLRGMVRRAKSFETYSVFTPEWFAEREKELRDLAKRGK